MKPINLAIVGATGLVGRTFLTIIDEFDIPIKSLKLFASSRSKGTIITFRDVEYTVEVIQEGSFLGVDYALFSAGASTSKQYARQATNEGAIVIDNSSAWRMHANVPLVVPEVNMEEAYDQSLIANPNCSTIQCVVPLSVLDQLYGLQQVEYNTYQAVSGFGQTGVNALKADGEVRDNPFSYDIRETAIPQIDEFLEDGYTKEEHKMKNETIKILGNDDLMVTASCVRIPVLHSHGVNIRVTLYERPNLDVLRQELARTPGIKVLDNPSKHLYPTSSHATGKNEIFVGRIRYDMFDPNAIQLYVVSDNIRKGAALNAVQIMMELINHDQSA